LRQLKQEIELLSYQIASTQSSLTASQDELAKLKKLLQERETQYQESVASWTRLNESLKTSESSLRKTRGWLIGSLAVNLVYRCRMLPYILAYLCKTYTLYIIRSMVYNN